MFENYTLKVIKMNENSKIGYIFQAKISKPVEDKGILWAPSPSGEGQCPPPPQPQGYSLGIQTALVIKRFDALEYDYM